MEKKLFPKEIIDHSSEANFSRHSVRTRLIYCTVLVAVAAGLAALPFAHVNVSVKGRGVIRPVTERNPIISPVSGKVARLFVDNNTFVKHGQVIAEIASPLLEEKLQFNAQRREEIKRYLHDLSLLREWDSISSSGIPPLQTPEYRRSFFEFRQQIHGIEQEIRQAERELERNRKLFNKKVISRAAYEEYVFATEAVRNERKLLLQQQLSRWQSDQTTYENDLEQLKTQEQQLQKEQDQYVIKAPVAGSILNLAGIYEGSFIYPNQKLAEISPDTGLVAECYVAPGDIGLVQKGMKARFHISAFNYNQWGVLTGRVEEVASDVAVLNNQPVFKVRCTLDQTYLSLQNGYRGNLKKGMTLQGRFTVARRSLFQLLFDNVDDWLNPQWNETQLTVSNN